MNNKRYQLPDRSIITLTPEDLDILEKMERIIYPPALREDRSSLERLLKSGTIHMGLIMKKKLVGFLITTNEYSEGSKYIFIWDISILPDFQKQGLGTLLLNHFLNQAHSKGLDVGAACRKTSLPLFVKAERLQKCGYRVAKCELEPDGYFQECGIHEDLYNVELEIIREEISS